jgi:hypothetical protein
MSPRRWLDKWPLRLRVFVLLLALLQLVAPSWHICALGGHALHCTWMEQASSPDGVLRPIICFCRADFESASAKYAKAWPNKLTVAPGGQDSSFCLARLLQTMPAQAALMAAPLAQVITTLAVPYPDVEQSAPARHVLAQHGRGPPDLC